eukprot:895282-Rhodomonas_salina.1
MLAHLRRNRALFLLFVVVIEPKVLLKRAGQHADRDRKEGCGEQAHGCLDQPAPGLSAHTRQHQPPGPCFLTRGRRRGVEEGTKEGREEYEGREGEARGDSGKGGRRE